MNICYLDFWPGFDPNSNWFNLVFREVLNDREINFNSSPSEADVIIFSCFGDQHQNYKNSEAIKVFYTGENQRADLTVADFSLSFDYETHAGKNFRLPHWYMYVNWWGEANFQHARISKEKLMYTHTPEEVLARENFCSIIIGNPVNNRIEVAQKLDTYKPVHGYGKVFGRPYSGCKVDLISKYRYNICFENSIYPGYITEKLLEAKVAGCIPIYYGSDTVSTDFNTNCFIDYTQIANPQHLLEKIIKIENNRPLFNELVSQKLFDKEPNLDNLYNFLLKVFKKYA